MREWYCDGCRKWFLWPHEYDPPSHLLSAFKWRFTGIKEVAK